MLLPATIKRSRPTSLPSVSTATSAMPAVPVMVTSSLGLSLWIVRQWPGPGEKLVSALTLKSSPAVMRVSSWEKRRTKDSVDSKAQSGPSMAMEPPSPRVLKETGPSSEMTLRPPPLRKVRSPKSASNTTRPSSAVKRKSREVSIVRALEALNPARRPSNTAVVKSPVPTFTSIPPLAEPYCCTTKLSCAFNVAVSPLVKTVSAAMSIPRAAVAIRSPVDEKVMSFSASSLWPWSERISMVSLAEVEKLASARSFM
mmetsp:Transcript_10552/g.43045  ORF Transcript_10552/g.43045 Transcript_10552/m.43045 type:complete len:256 (-) Transcript_10552:3338-4105(-)